MTGVPDAEVVGLGVFADADAESEFEELAGWNDRLNPPEVARSFRASLGIA